ncbi:MAG: Rpn family recombination-promoting nuclease/putative transposase, partial [Synergistaceae bacterium]|nr:Rpn family recombination-promoting nuclease/putative transposase [Synergistaceae bacterium]
MDYLDRTIYTDDMEAEFQDVRRRGELPGEINRFRDGFLKHLLAEPERNHLMIDVLNCTLRVAELEPMKALTPLDREFSSRFSGGKGIRLDYFARDECQRSFDAEFQGKSTPEFMERALYCGCSLVTRQLHSGDKYDKIIKEKSIFMGYLNFSPFPDDRWIRTFRMRDENGLS